MNTCGTCRAWRRLEELPRGTCERARSEAGRPLDIFTFAYAMDVEANAAWLLCDEQFGCMQWQPILLPPGDTHG